MKTRAHVSFLSLIGIFLASGWLTLAQAQDQNVNGNLTVTGSATVTGTLSISGMADFNHNTTNFGTNGLTPSTPGVVLTYTDTASGTISTITLATGGTTAIWQWERNSANGLIPQMSLTGTNSLILWNPTNSTSAAITLNPTGDSTFAGSLVATGTNSQLPNQTLTSSGSIVTRDLGDARYLQIGDSSGVNYLTPTQISGSYMPLVPTKLAVGTNTTASGTNSVAMGYQTVASGAYATAIGANTTASGANSAAFGDTTTAQGYGQLVIGRYNILQGNATSWIATDDIFIIGNGTSASARSNAFSIKKNGDTTVNGNATISGNTAVTGKFKVTGVATFSDRLVANGGIRVSPQGDISMGDFTGGDLTAAQAAAASYAATLAVAGKTLSTTESANISSFITSLDNIVGLDNVVECWTLRSGQNSGAGSTVYGMLGHYMGSIIGTLSWNETGIAWPASGTNYIATTCSLSSPNSSMIVVARNTNNDVNITKYFLIYKTAGIAGEIRPGIVSDYDAYYVDWGVRIYGGVCQLHGTTNTRMLGISQSGANVTKYLSGVVTGSVGTTATDQTGASDLRIGEMVRNYEIAFALMARTELTADQHLQIYTLYKNTIGQGLNLP